MVSKFLVCVGFCIYDSKGLCVIKLPSLVILLYDEKAAGCLATGTSEGDGLRNG